METSCVSQLRLDDDKLVSLGLEGDHGALHTLLTRYRRLLYALAYRLLHNHEEAEDAVQCCLLQAFRNLECLNCRGSFRSWLVRILINEALVIIRKKKSRPTTNSERQLAEEREAHIECFPAPGPNPEQKLARQECLAAVMTHLARLPAPLRSAILLCDIGEHTIQEASAILALSPNTVKMRLHRARTKLRLAIGRSLPPVNIPDALIGV